MLINPLPDRSNYSPLCHTHYLSLDQYFTSLFRPDLSLLPFSILSLLPLPHPFFLFWSILCFKIKSSSFITVCFTNGIFFCILFHTMTYFFNNAFYKLVKTNFDAWAPTCHTLRTWRNNGYIAGLDLEILIKGGLSGPPSVQIVFLSLSLSPLCYLSQSSLFSLSSFPLASLPSLLALLINSLSS